MDNIRQEMDKVMSYPTAVSYGLIALTTVILGYYTLNDDLRVKYLKNELKEEVWGRFLFTNYKNMKLKVNYREVIELY